MKRIFLLCVIMGAAVVMVGCASQATNTAEDRVNARGGLVDAGSVAPTSIGPTHHFERSRFQP
jgi:hypothetical protein